MSHGALPVQEDAVWSYQYAGNFPAPNESVVHRRTMEVCLCVSGQYIDRVIKYARASKSCGKGDQTFE